MQLLDFHTPPKRRKAADKSAAPSKLQSQNINPASLMQGIKNNRIFFNAVMKNLIARVAAKYMGEIV